MNLKHLLFLAVAGTMAIACNEVDEASSINSQKTLGTISSGSDRFATRVNLDSEWEDGDAIGVYMFDTNNKNILNQAINVKYEADASGINTAFTASPGIAIYDEPANFIAYYPHSADANNIDVAAALYKVDISNQSAGLSTHDLMWAKAADKATDDLLTNGLSLTFRHQLALLRVNIKNENVTNVESVTVGGMNTTATFNLIDGVLTNIATTKAMTLYKAGAKSFVGVMLPTTELKKKMSLTVVANGKKFQYSVPESSAVTEFEAGYEYSFNITLTKTDGSELDGNEGSNEPWQPGGNEEGTGGEVADNPNIPDDYTQIQINASTDLTTVLSSATDKTALVFATGSEYSTSGDIIVPNSVTELMLIGNGNTQVKLALRSIINSGLQKLTLNNLNITGNNNYTLLSNATGDILTNQFAANAVIEIKNCELSGMKYVCKWDGDKNYDAERNALSSFTVENCFMHDMRSVFEEYRSTAITLTNSTFYMMTEQAIHPHTYGTAPNPTITVQHCTLANLTGTPLQGTNNGCNIVYENNVSTQIDPKYSNLSYNTTTSTGSGNYAVKNDSDGKVATGGFKDGVTFNKEYTETQMFTNAANGDFTLLIDAKVGDPRWYKSAK